MEGTVKRKISFFFELGYFVLKLVKGNSYWKGRDFQKIIAIWRNSTLCYTVLFDYKGAKKHKKLNRKLFISRVASLKTRLLFEKNMFISKDVVIWKNIIILWKESS